MISVIIPAHNEDENLQKLLPRIAWLGKNHDMEVLVCLSKDTKDNSHKIKEFNGLNYINCDKKGRAVQMNRGAAIAKGEILVFLHADVMPPDGFFENIKQTIAIGKDAGFFSYRFDKESFFLKINSFFTSKDGIFTGGGDQCLFIKKTVFENIGRFDEKQMLMEDFEIFKRMKAKNISYSIVKNDLVVSSRKYEENSYLRVNVTNLLLVVLFKFGYAPKKLEILHNKLLSIPYQNN